MGTSHVGLETSPGPRKIENDPKTDEIEFHLRVSSLHWLILLSFCSFLYNGVWYKVFKLSENDVIVSLKGSNGEWK